MESYEKYMGANYIHGTDFGIAVFATLSEISIYYFLEKCGVFILKNNENTNAIIKLLFSRCERGRRFEYWKTKFLRKQRKVKDKREVGSKEFGTCKLQQEKPVSLKLDSCKNFNLSEDAFTINLDDVNVHITDILTEEGKKEDGSKESKKKGKNYGVRSLKHDGHDSAYKPQNLGKTLGKTFRARQASPQSLRSDYMHGSPQDSPRDSFFTREERDTIKY